MKNSKKAVLILHQFPISHFCEKVRLALTLKEVEYETRNHLPLLHLLTVHKVSGQTMVPVIEIDGKVICDSNRIMKYLDQKYPKPKLYPDDKKKLAELDGFIQRVDIELGVHLRRYLYDMILPDLKVLVNLLAGNGFNRLEKAAFRALAPVVRVMMRQGMKINPRGVARSHDMLMRVLDDLDARIRRRKYFFGNALSAADITVAGLIAPLVMPDHYPVDWPEQLPERFETFREACSERPVYQWAEEFYKSL